MCINNTVRDVLSSHPHHQPLRKAVAAFPKARKGTEVRTKTLVFDLGTSLGLDGAHEPHLLAVRHQRGHTEIWVFLFFFLTM